MLQGQVSVCVRMRVLVSDKHIFVLPGRVVQAVGRRAQSADRPPQQIMLKISGNSRPTVGTLDVTSSLYIFRILTSEPLITN